jgi:hypothetical protein
VAALLFAFFCRLTRERVNVTLSGSSGLSLAADCWNWNDSICHIRILPQFGSGNMPYPAGGFSLPGVIAATIPVMPAQKGPHKICSYQVRKFFQYIRKF